MGEPKNEARKGRAGTSPRAQVEGIRSRVMAAQPSSDRHHASANHHHPRGEPSVSTVPLSQPRSFHDVGQASSSSSPMSLISKKR